MSCRRVYKDWKTEVNRGKIDSLRGNYDIKKDGRNRQIRIGDQSYV